MADNLQKDLEKLYIKIRTAVEKQDAAAYFSLTQSNRKTSGNQKFSEQQLKEMLQFFKSWFPDLKNAEFLKLETLKNGTNEWAGYWLLAKAKPFIVVKNAPPPADDFNIYFYPFHKTQNGWKLFTEVQITPIEEVANKQDQQKIVQNALKLPDLSLKEKASNVEESDFFTLEL